MGCHTPTYALRVARATYTDKALAAALQQNATIAGVLRMLGLKPEGGNYRVIQRRIAALGLSTQHLEGSGLEPRSITDLQTSPAPALRDSRGRVPLQELETEVTADKGRVEAVSV